MEVGAVEVDSCTQYVCSVVGEWQVQEMVKVRRRPITAERNGAIYGFQTC